MALDPISAIADFASKLVDVGSKFIPDEKNRLEFESKVMEYASRQQEAVNATMREEAKSEHPIVYSWRPLVGLTFCGVIINNYILIPYFQVFGLNPIEIPDGIWQTMLVILGVAAGTRGWEKIERGKQRGK